jgi:xanthine dehydrogenase accessory factor
VIDNEMQNGSNRLNNTDTPDIFSTIVSARENGQALVLVTITRVIGSVPRHAGSKMLVWPDGHIIGTVGGGAMEARVIQEAQDAFADGQPRMVSYTLNSPVDGDPGICGGTVEVFIEPLLAAPTLLVIGCGHVGKALAALGQWLGYRVVVSDDRAEFCNEAIIPDMAGYVVCPSAEVPKNIAIDRHTYVAAVTRGLPVDLDLIPALLATPAAYLGLIGSRRRWALTIKALEERGITRDQLARIHAPIGLELQAETPQEIALSIMAEITSIRRGGNGQPMRA